MTNQIKPEIWRTIKDFPDYAVSTNGRVKRIKATKKNSYVGRILKPYLSGRKYLRVLLSSPKYKKHKAIQHLVLETFISPRPESKECNHKDGIKDNDRLSNLEWNTPKENTHHAWRTGLCKYEKTPQHREALKKRWLRDRSIPVETVRQIKKMRVDAGIGKRRLSRIFRVSENIVGHILRGVSYKEVAIGLD